MTQGEKVPSIRHRVGAHPFSRRAADRFRPVYRKYRPWTGLDGVDRKLLPLLPRGAGVFIEAGANDGIKQSNTHGLERVFGWNGILIEPVTTLARQCSRHRSRAHVVNAALVAPSEAGKLVRVISLDLMTRVESFTGDTPLDAHVSSAATTGVVPSHIDVVGRTLSEIIDSSVYCAIDFLSLDVEGYEIHALAGLDISRHAPKVALVETIDPARVLAALGAAYSASLQLSERDYVFVRDDWFDACGGHEIFKQMEPYPRNLER